MLRSREEIAAGQKRIKKAILIVFSSISFFFSYFISSFVTKYYSYLSKYVDYRSVGSVDELSMFELVYIFWRFSYEEHFLRVVFFFCIILFIFFYILYILKERKKYKQRNTNKKNKSLF